MWGNSRPLANWMFSSLKENQVFIPSRYHILYSHQKHLLIIVIFPADIYLIIMPVNEGKVACQ